MPNNTILLNTDLSDRRYNPKTFEYSPKKIGYGVVSSEIRTIPNSSPFFIKLHEIPQQTLPSVFVVTPVAGGNAYREVGINTTPGKEEFRVSYFGILGAGIVEFNSAQAGIQVEIKYYGLGNGIYKQVISASLLNRKAYKIIASTDSTDKDKRGADYVVNTSDNSATIINNYITEINNAGGGVLLLMDGTYNIESAITLKSNVSIKGMSWQTKIVKTALIGGSPARIIECANADYVTLENFSFDLGGGAMAEHQYAVADDNNYTNKYKNILVTNLYYTGTEASGCFVACNNMLYCKVDHVRIDVTNANTYSGGGFLQCYNLKLCVALDCKRSGANNFVDGFFFSRSLSNCYATNNDNGFKVCRHMTLNRSTGNTQNNYLNSTANWAATILVADNAAGGFNA